MAAEKIVLLVVVVELVTGAACANINLLPKTEVNLLDKFFAHKVPRFGGKVPSSNDVCDHFKLLEADDDSILLGARNFVFNLNVSTLEVNYKITWKPPDNITSECNLKGKELQDCQNYIRVLARQDNDKMLICGTHAFKPMCREYSTKGPTPQAIRSFDGQGISPFSPKDNSTFFYLAEKDEIFTGTVSDFVGSDPLIFRKKLSKISDGIRTQRDDYRVLDNPNFVGSFEYKEFIYFWYRERASEVMDNNEEKQVYARVSRVCKNDRGAPRPANEKWTSFIKARLNCSLPAATPFYFNELKAISKPVAASSDHLVYAVFSTPETQVRMSAVCVFSMNRISEEFQTGTFKQQQSSTHLWGPIPLAEIPRPRPGTCVPDSTKLPEATISFVLRNPLLHKAIPAIKPPIIVEGTDRADLTQITVLSESFVGNEVRNLIYIGTSDGRVLKVVEIEEKTSLIHFIRVVSSGPIVNLLTLPKQNKIVVVTPDEVALIPTNFCALSMTCASCVALQDPQCAWNTTIARCVPITEFRDGNYIQSITTGKNAQCPFDDASSIETEQANIGVFGSSSFTVKHLILACVICILLAGVFGLFIGYRVSKTRLMTDNHHSNSSTSGSDYDSFGRQTARLTRHDSLTNTNKIEQVYGIAPKHSMDGTSLVMHPTMSLGHVHSGAASGFTTPSRDRNTVLTSLGQSTLPRDYKVKKVYL